MSFDVFLIPSSETPDEPVFQSRASAACEGIGATWLDDGVRFANGGSVEVYGGDEGGVMFALRAFAPAIVELIYAVADATSCFIMWEGDMHRTPGNEGALPGGNDVPFELVSSWQELGERIAPDFGDWSSFAAEARVMINPPGSET